jgi:hypothetical protein
MKIKFSSTDKRPELGMPRDEEMQSISDVNNARQHLSVFVAVCLYVFLSVCLSVCVRLILTQDSLNRSLTYLIIRMGKINHLVRLES